MSTINKTIGHDFNLWPNLHIILHKTPVWFILLLSLTAATTLGSFIKKTLTLVLNQDLQTEYPQYYTNLGFYEGTISNTHKNFKNSFTINMLNYGATLQVKKFGLILNT